jgi:hypothetical protein
MMTPVFDRENLHGWDASTGDGVERSCAGRGEGRVVKPWYLNKGVRDDGLKSEITDALVSEFSDKDAPTPQKTSRKPLGSR